ncbi:MAG: FKBP-type peptidyl-prolyl cis-trans isomerase [Paludibacteraceae bacterium]|nr:FKBP-type peptidyl-prolyl cis-trans isomerase [Paludibacteraceae bacterium]MBO7724171.1 FKBP-type peptidyl-prolyl cis-trans isomerase [Paludibacteraceae bacterium]
MKEISYALGVNIGKSLKNSGIQNIDATDFAKGMNDVLSGNSLDIPESEARELLNDYFKKLQEERMRKNKTEGKQFLEENAKKEGIITTESGLQYQILTEGKGETPKASDRVKVHYHGTLINGTVFDSSVQRGEPAVFGVTQVISGWVEALQLMPVGSKWRLFIPHKLAYGAQGAGEMIQPFSTLIFDVELIEIVK